MVVSTIKEWLAATTFEIKKLCTLKENCSLKLNTVTYKVEMFFKGQLIYFGSQSSLMNCYFSQIFVHRQQLR